MIAVDDRADPAVRLEMSGPALRTFLNVASAWNLTVQHQRGLLGWPAESTFFKYKAGQIGTLAYDVLIRISLVLGIYKALHILYAEDSLANRWPSLPNENPIFAGEPAIHLMVHGGIDGLYQVRRLLDSRRGGAG